MNTRRSYALAVFAGTLAVGSACMTGDPNPYYVALASSSDGGSTSSTSGGSSTSSSSSGGSSSSSGGPPDGALAAQGSGKYFTFDDKELPQGSSARTVEAWVQSKSAGEGYAFCYGPVKVGQGFCLGTDGSKGITTQIGDSFLGSPVANGAWRHLAVTFDGLTYTLYVDGKPDGSKAMKTATTLQGQAFVGSSVPPGDKSFFGLVDELRVWNVARTAQEIASSFDRRLTGNEPGLVIYLTFDNATLDGAGEWIIPNKASASSVKTAVSKGKPALDPGVVLP